MKLAIAAAAFATAFTTLANAALVEQWWSVEYVDGVDPLGLQPRRVIGVNGTWPPPIINVNSSDQLKIHVTNHLGSGKGTALHSHGMYFNGTGYYDGATGITQCPIPPNQTFSYEVLNSPKSPEGARKQWGTFWTHGHFDGQYVDGLRTPSIIHADTTDTQAYQYDEDFTIVLGDWYLDEHDELMKQFISDTNPSGAEPVPDSAIVYFARTPQNGTATYFPGFNDAAALPFEPNKTYRIRLVNTGALAMFHFWIDGHQMRLIEADGNDLEEKVVDRVTLSVAQRYSLLVTTKGDASTNYKIHAHMDPDMFDAVPDSLQLNVTATAQYNSAADATVAPEETREYGEMLNDAELVPFYPEPSYPADVSKDLNVWFDTRSDGANYAAFNNISFKFPLTPSLFTANSMGQLAMDSAVYGPSAHAIVVEKDQVFDLTIINWDAGYHPFHLHGHHFQIVHKTMDVASTDPAVNAPFTPATVADNPMRRDTVMVPPGGSATLRVRADNPGAWLMHCHIEWHLNSGLSLVIMEAPDLIPQRLSIDAASPGFCQAQGISTTGNAGGLNSTMDFGAAPIEVPFLETGWTGKAYGSIVGCGITALLGLGTVVYYSLGRKDDEGEQEGREE